MYTSTFSEEFLDAKKENLRLVYLLKKIPNALSIALTRCMTATIPHSLPATRGACRLTRWAQLGLCLYLAWTTTSAVAPTWATLAICRLYACLVLKVRRYEAGFLLFIGLNLWSLKRCTWIIIGRGIITLALISIS